MKRVGWTATIFLLTPLMVRADDPEARAVVDRAVEAIGGANKLKNLAGGRLENERHGHGR
jgi:hypothetical protein